MTLGIMRTLYSCTIYRYFREKRALQSQANHQFFLTGGVITQYRLKINITSAASLLLYAAASAAIANAALSVPTVCDDDDLTFCCRHLQLPNACNAT